MAKICSTALQFTLKYLYERKLYNRALKLCILAQKKDIITYYCESKLLC